MLVRHYNDSRPVVNAKTPWHHRLHFELFVENEYHYIQHLKREANNTTPFEKHHTHSVSLFPKSPHVLKEILQLVLRLDERNNVISEEANTSASSGCNGCSDEEVMACFPAHHLNDISFNRERGGSGFV